MRELTLEQFIHHLKTCNPQVPIESWISHILFHIDSLQSHIKELEPLVGVSVISLANKKSKALGDADHYKQCAEGWMKLAKKAEAQRDYLVELIVKAAKWPKGCESYAHAIGHIENVISNLRCDASTEKKLREQTEAENAKMREALERIAKHSSGMSCCLIAEQALKKGESYE